MSHWEACIGMNNDHSWRTSYTLCHNDDNRLRAWNTAWLQVQWKLLLWPELVYSQMFTLSVYAIDCFLAFVAQDTLRLWHEKNHRWLELSDVHRETTEDIRVTAIPFYMGSRVQCCLFVWNIIDKICTIISYYGTINVFWEAHVKFSWI